MPKVSEQKKAELENLNKNRVHQSREPAKKLDNYLDFVRSENAKRPRKLTNVTSLPDLALKKRPHMLHSSEKLGGLRQSVQESGSIEWEGRAKAKSKVVSSYNRRDKKKVLEDDDFTAFGQASPADKRAKIGILNNKVRDHEDRIAKDELLARARGDDIDA